MTGREKVLAALRRESGEVPIDFGATAVTGMHCSCVAALRDYYGLEKRPVLVHDPYQMLGWIDDDLAAALNISTIAPLPAGNLFGIDNADFKEWRTPWGQPVLVGGAFEVDERGGDLFIYPGGDRGAEPSGHMPEGGYFFDAIIRQESFDEDELRAEDNLEEFSLLDDAFLAKFAEDCRRAAASGRAVVAGLPGMALGDIALVPGTFMKKPKGIRDVTEWYVSLAARPELVREIFDRQSEIALRNLAKIGEAAGGYLDVVMLCGTDFGTQNGPFCSTESFRELYLPYYRRMTDWIHENTAWKVFKHSCGSIVPLLDSFAEAGFDILNPVQCSAAGMDPEALKAAYGDRFVFWGGGVDTQRTLPFGTPAEVRAQVLERCRIFSKNGGFVFCSIHNVQALTPTENLVAMFDAVAEFNR